MPVLLSRASAALALLMAVLTLLPERSMAQSSGNNAPSRSLQYDDEDLRCGDIPGGNAPVERMARIEGGISVRNLELTYDNKPLYEFTAEDFEFLPVRWAECGTFEQPIAELIARKLRNLVDDARSTRQKSIEWIEKTKVQVDELPPGKESIQVIHDLWQEMLNREYEMLRSDVAYISDVLAKRQEEIYAGKEKKQRILIKPFDPGPSDIRRLPKK